MRKRVISCITALFMLLMLAAAPISAMAAYHGTDAYPDCTLKIDYSYQPDKDSAPEPIEGATFTIYRVWDFDDNGNYILSDDFTYSGLKFEEIKTAADMIAAIHTIERNMLDHPTEGLSGTTGPGGTYIFQGISEVGIYLVKQTDATGNSQNFAYADAFLVQIPGVTDPPGYEKNVVVHPKPAKLPPTYDVTVEKVWDDQNNEDKIRPVQVNVQLYQNGEPQGSVVTLNEDNSWKYAWKDLPAKDADGKAITYTVDEPSVPTGYTRSVTDMKSVTEEGTTVCAFTITNTHPITPPDNPPDNPPSKENPRISISVNKKWDDEDNKDKLRPESVKVQLYIGKEKIGPEVTLNEKNKWSYTWKNMPQKAGGKDIDYRVDEVLADDVAKNYTKSISDRSVITKDDKTTYRYTVTNTHKIKKKTPPTTTTTPNPPGKKTPTRPPHNVRTGDTLLPILYGCIIAAAAVALIVVLAARRRRKRDQV